MTLLERNDLHAAIELRYQDNTTGDITPKDLRDGLHELVDSVFLPASDELPPSASLLVTAREDVFVDPAYAIAAAYLNRALTIRSYAQASVAVTLPPLTTQLVPALLRLEHQSGIGGTTCLLSVPGVGRPLEVGEHVFLAGVATPAVPANPASGYPGASAGTAWVVLSEPDPRAQVDLLDLTGAQMLDVMALTYTNCDAAPADSPSWSFPGMWFDAINPADGGNYRYSCGRSPFIPGNNTSGSGPAWTRVKKL